MPLFFIFARPVFPDERPLRPPMWGGEPYTVDPERTVAAAVRDGGDETYRQSAAEQGQMMPREPDIDVKDDYGGDC